MDFKHPLNWRELRVVLRFYYNTDPSFSSIIDMVAEITTRECPLIMDIHYNIVYQLAMEFWLFGNAFYDFKNEIIIDPDVVKVTRIPWEINPTYSILHKYPMSGQYLSINENVPLIHLRKKRMAYDVMGSPLTILNEENKIVGYRDFDKKDLASAFYREMKRLKLCTLKKQ